MEIDYSVQNENVRQTTRYDCDRHVSNGKTPTSGVLEPISGLATSVDRHGVIERVSKRTHIGGREHRKYRNDGGRQRILRENDRTGPDRRDYYRSDVRDGVGTEEDRHSHGVPSPTHTEIRPRVTSPTRE